MAAEEAYLAGNKLPDGVDARAVERGDLVDRVADGGVDSLEFVVDGPQLIVVEVALVEDEHCGDVVGFGGDEEAVDEACGGAREAEGGDEAEEVDVGGDDVGLLAELGGAADDIVAAVGDIGNHACAVIEEQERDAIAYGDGVGLLAAAKAIVAAEATVDDVAARRHYTIPAACGADD